MNRQELAKVCEVLREIQRQRAKTVQSIIGVTNRLVSQVATSKGYTNAMNEQARKKFFDGIRKECKAVADGKVNDHQFKGLILATYVTINAYEEIRDEFELRALEEMEKLPWINEWIDNPDRAGVKGGIVAQIIGECGDLNNYPNPSKVWKRMGCAPFELDGVTHMPSTWMKLKRLSKEDWVKIGYSPRRRSLAYNLGECLIKNNFYEGAHKCKTEGRVRPAGPYRKRYDDAKADAVKRHPEWCNPKTPGVGIRYNLHGNLLCAKMFLRDLWERWTDGGRFVYLDAWEKVADVTLIGDEEFAEIDECDIGFGDELIEEAMAD